MFSVVVALDQNRGIGRDGRLPWKLAGDTRFFRELTTCPDRAAVERRYGLAADAPDSPLPWAECLAGFKALPPLPMPTPDARNAVILGRNTWNSLPDGYKPLPNRLNAVLSRQDQSEGTHRVWADLGDALADLARDQSVREVFVIGGAQVYAEALRHPGCARIYLTEIDAAFPCDAFFPELPPEFRAAAASRPLDEDGIRYRFRLLQRGAG